MQATQVSKVRQCNVSSQYGESYKPSRERTGMRIDWWPPLHL